VHCARACDTGMMERLMNLVIKGDAMRTAGGSWLRLIRPCSMKTLAAHDAAPGGSYVSR